MSAVLFCALPVVRFTIFAQTPESQDAQSSRTAKKKAVAENTATSPAQQTESASKSLKTTAPTKNASSAEIAAAKASGKVWVNTETGVYHKAGHWYGATKQGKFMTEQEAIKAGYRAAKHEK
jgi:hypothetical protein